MMTVTLSEQIHLMAQLLAQDARSLLPHTASPISDLTLIQEAALRFQTRFAAAWAEWDSWDAGRRGTLRHALKNDLNLVVGFGHLLLRDSAASLDTTQRALLDTICQRGRLLASLVNGLR